MKLYIKVIVLILIIIFIMKLNNPKDYKYGAIYTSNSESIIALYNNEGEYLYDKKFKIYGLNFGSFIKKGIELNDKLYFTAPLGGNIKQEFILEIDKDRLLVNKIKTEITPTFFSVDENYIFSGISSIENSIINKTDIDKNIVVNSTTINGQAINITQNQNEIYVFCINHKNSNEINSGTLFILDKTNFKVLNEIEVLDISFTSDILKIDNYIYILVTYNGKDNKGNQIKRINIDDGSMKAFNVSFENLAQMHVSNDDIYIVESDFHREIICNSIFKLNAKTNEIEVFEVKANIISSIISNEKFIYSDGEKIYIYNLSDFKFIEEFNLKEYEDNVFISIFIN